MIQKIVAGKELIRRQNILKIIRNKKEVADTTYEVE